MLKTRKYIGGDFDASASDSFLVKDFPIETFFPRNCQTLKRNFFETATDSFAAIVEEIFSESGRGVQLWYPAHYCIETILRLKIKTTHISLKASAYNSTEDVKPEKGSVNVFLFNHFNGYNHNADAIFKRSFAQDWVIIEDFVHAPLDISKTKGGYSFNSLRKLSDVEISICYGLKNNIAPSASASYYFNIKKEAARLKTEFFATEKDSTEQEYLTLFKKAEKSLDRKEIVTAYEQELNRLVQIDWQKILQHRKRNYGLFKTMVTSRKEINILPGEYMYMVMKAEKRNQLKEHMFSQGIFPVVHWPDSIDPIKHELLSFHIDQRYGKEDIERTCTALLNFYSS